MVISAKLAWQLYPTPRNRSPAKASFRFHLLSTFAPHSSSRELRVAYMALPCLGGITWKWQQGFTRLYRADSMPGEWSSSHWALLAAHQKKMASISHNPLQPTLSTTARQLQLMMEETHSSIQTARWASAFPLPRRVANVP